MLRLQQKRKLTLLLQSTNWFRQDRFASPVRGSSYSLFLSIQHLWHLFHLRPYFLASLLDLSFVFILLQTALVTALRGRLLTLFLYLFILYISFPQLQLIPALPCSSWCVCFCQVSLHAICSENFWLSCLFSVFPFPFPQRNTEAVLTPWSHQQDPTRPSSCPQSCADMWPSTLISVPSLAVQGCLLSAYWGQGMKCAPVWLRTLSNRGMKIPAACPSLLFHCCMVRWAGKMFLIISFSSCNSHFVYRKLDKDKCYHQEFWPKLLFLNILPIPLPFIYIWIIISLKLEPLCWILLG